MPVPTVTEPRVGRLIGPQDIRGAVLSTLQRWLPSYLQVVEADRGLSTGALTRPPTPASYRGSIDFEAWQQDETPQIIVTVEPAGGPERSASAGYTQDFEVRVAAVVVITGDVNAALELAGFYGTAIQGAITQQGGLGGIGEITRLATSPTDQWDDQDVRDRVRNVTSFHVWVASTVNDQLGFDTPEPPPLPAEPWSVITSTNVTLVAVPITAAFTANTIAGTPVLTNVSPMPDEIIPGQMLLGPGIPAGSFVIDRDFHEDTITFSRTASANGTGVTVSLI